MKMNKGNCLFKEIQGYGKVLGCLALAVCLAAHALTLIWDRMNRTPVRIGPEGVYRPWWMKWLRRIR